jgi:hypothetical protein
MGVIKQLKKLHKQTMLKLADIRSTQIVDVDFGKYLSRARTLKSYTDKEEDAEVEHVTMQTATPKATKSTRQTKKK